MKRSQLKEIMKELLFEVLTEELSKGIVKEMVERIQSNTQPKRKVNSLVEATSNEHDEFRKEIRAGDIKNVLAKKLGRKETGDAMVDILAETAMQMNDEVQEDSGVKIGNQLLDVDRNARLLGLSRQDKESNRTQTLNEVFAQDDGELIRVDVSGDGRESTRTEPKNKPKGILEEAIRVDVPGESRRNISVPESLETKSDLIMDNFTPGKPGLNFFGDD